MDGRDGRPAAGRLVVEDGEPELKALQIRLVCAGQQPCVRSLPTRSQAPTRCLELQGHSGKHRHLHTHWSEPMRSKDCWWGAGSSDVWRSISCVLHVKDVIQGLGLLRRQ